MALRVFASRLLTSYKTRSVSHISLFHRLNNLEKIPTFSTRTSSSIRSISTAMEVKNEEKEESKGGQTSEDLKDEKENVKQELTKIMTPPICKGMTTLDRSAFDKEINIPILIVKEAEGLSQAYKTFKQYYLKNRKFRAVVDLDDEKKTKKIYLNPDLIKEYKSTDDFLQELKSKITNPDVIESIQYENVKYTYEHWGSDELLNSVLPDEFDKVGGFSKIGHVLHLNLRDRLLPYKQVIGQILLDNIPGCLTVLNKTNTIDNTYRNFQMEILAGENNTIVQTKEANCIFELDFAKVYWNPRLGTEHQRICSFLNKGETLYDVFAGVGPFAIPAGKKKVNVFANDLNPESFKWLQNNVKKNKVVDFVQTFNQDGRDFIRSVVKTDLQEKVNKGETQLVFHVTMNLPGMAVEFLDSFWNLLDDNPNINDLKVMVHVYCFIKSELNDFRERAIDLVKEHLNYDLKDEQMEGCYYVRLVAPKKEMRRVSFQLPNEILTREKPTTPILQTPENNSLKRKFSDICDDEVS